MSSNPVEFMNSNRGSALYRIFMSGASTAIAAGVMYLITEQSKTKELLYAYQFSNNERIAKLEGQVGEIKGSVATHRDRIKDNDTSINNLWTRLYDMARGK